MINKFRLRYLLINFEGVISFLKTFSYHDLPVLFCFDSYIFSTFLLGKTFYTKFFYVINSDIFRRISQLGVIYKLRIVSSH